MKIYFNSTFIEKERVTDDNWVKGNNGNKLEAFFDDLDLNNTNLNLKLVIEWSNNETSNELPMNKNFDNKFAYINLPEFQHAGNTKFIIKIYQNSTLLQTAIFTRNIKETIEASDRTNIGSDEYQVLLNQINDINSKANKNTQNINSLSSRVTLLEQESSGGGTIDPSILTNYYNKQETQDYVDTEVSDLRQEVGNLYVKKTEVITQAQIQQMIDNALFSAITGEV